MKVRLAIEDGFLDTEDEIKERMTGALSHPPVKKSVKVKDAGMSFTGITQRSMT